MDKKEVEIPFGAKDSELVEATYHIPDGMEAVIEGNKIIIRKKMSENEKIRKELIHLVKKSNEYGGYALHKYQADKMINWLEKQGEQKLTKWKPTKMQMEVLAHCADQNNGIGFVLTSLLNDLKKL